MKASNISKFVGPKYDCISPDFVSPLEGRHDLSIEVLPNLIDQVLVYEIEYVLIDIGSLFAYQPATIAYAKTLPGDFGG